MDPMKRSQIATAVKAAFGDCQQSGYPMKSIQFKPTEELELNDAMAIMQDALPKDYNDYHNGRVLPRVRGIYPEVMVRIARDEGPILYFVGEKAKLLDICKIARDQLLVSGCTMDPDGSLKLSWR